MGVAFSALVEAKSLFPPSMQFAAYCTVIRVYVATQVLFLGGFVSVFKICSVDHENLLEDLLIA